MKNWIIIGAIVLIIGLDARYVYQARKKGNKCIGCPHSGSCTSCSSEITKKR